MARLPAARARTASASSVTAADTSAMTRGRGRPARCRLGDRGRDEFFDGARAGVGGQRAVLAGDRSRLVAAFRKCAETHLTTGRVPRRGQSFGDGVVTGGEAAT